MNSKLIKLNRLSRLVTKAVRDANTLDCLLREVVGADSKVDNVVGKLCDKRSSEIRAAISAQDDDARSGFKCDDDGTHGLDGRGRVTILNGN